ncbi:OLC1v1010015C1 [Oldenlandia corymbosa var. corymbosa]|uniref:OLC1v1010015C1 n=1 Tax=Oldenlandia corymbosa var. corymbosa TaxID=529605 RepID=A0AAV1DTJ7_OLDCO|nr:OLC1v1010015C1 [Oldenlandia corymbosa var. corymbosa]
MAEETPSSGIEGSNMEQNQNSVEATIESEVLGGAAESTCNNAESSAGASGEKNENSLEKAEDLMDRGSKAAKENDYATATDLYSRALEIRVALFGELAPECVHAYYKYGCALLYKAQDEADPLGTVPKKEGEVKGDSDKEGSVKSVTGESSTTTTVANNTEGETADEGKDQEEDDEESDGEDVAEGDEDESDLDLAWKMLDVARAIVEKHSGDTMEKVDILSALAEVALEREDIETSLSDYLKALSILERLVEPDSRHLAELNFRICLCLEIGSKPEEAIPFCQKAISICKSRVERLKNEANDLVTSTSKVNESESGQTLQQSSSTTQSAISAADKESEIETLTGLSVELEKKVWITLSLSLLNFV